MFRPSKPVFHSPTTRRGLWPRIQPTTHRIATLWKHTTRQSGMHLHAMVRATQRAVLRRRLQDTQQPHRTPATPHTANTMRWGSSSPSNAPLTALQAHHGASSAPNAPIRHFSSHGAPSPRATVAKALLVGLVVGVGITAAAGWAWLRLPYRTEGVDFNGDGIVDSTRTLSASGRTLRIEIDRNRDGKVDRIQTTNVHGDIESSSSDDDFDGVFESQTWFSNGQLEMSQTDADGDGFAEVRSFYPYGVKSTTRYLDPISRRDVRIEHFKLGVLAFAVEDVEGNGKLNHRIDYSPTGKVTHTSKLK